MYTTSPSLRRARSAGPTGVPSSTSSIRTSSSRITVTGAVSPVRLGGWPATGTTRLRSAYPFSLHRASPAPLAPVAGLPQARPGSVPHIPSHSTGGPQPGATRWVACHRHDPAPFRMALLTPLGVPSPVRLGGWPATGTTRLRSAWPFSLHRPASAPLPPSRAVSFHAITAIVVGEPQRDGPNSNPPVPVDPGRLPARRETEAVQPNGPPA